eukprot:1160138-Pelagomonas_calceolata.AAC.9
MEEQHCNHISHARSSVSRHLPWRHEPHDHRCTTLRNMRLVRVAHASASSMQGWFEWLMPQHHQCRAGLSGSCLSIINAGWFERLMPQHHQCRSDKKALASATINADVKKKGGKEADKDIKP